MRTSSNGRAFIKNLEGLRLDVYPDGGGVATVGWGHVLTKREASVLTHISMAAAESYFDDDLGEVEDAFWELVRIPLVQHQYDAIASWLFNVGTGKSIRGSQTLRILNAGDRESFADRLLRWKFDNGKEVRGLLNRRRAERHLFLTGEYEMDKE